MIPILYPYAKWKPLLNHSTVGVLSERSLIVLHCTSGPTAQSAINTFINSVSPNRVSAHFVIDRDGSVTQLVDINDSAWHASAVNGRSIGIEHAAIPVTLMATDAQYEASAKLVAWLCSKMGMVCSRNTVQGHNEASPQDKHTQCPSGALSVDKVVTMAQAILLKQNQGLSWDEAGK